MSKVIRIEDIENSIWTYLQYLEELMIRLTMYELEIDRIMLRLQLEQHIEDDVDEEYWYSD